MPDPSYDLTSLALQSAQDELATAEHPADAALKVSERRYRRLFEAARDGILLLNSETGRITDANPFMTELLGYSHAELIGKELWEIGLPKDKAASQKEFRLIGQDGVVHYEDLPLETRGGERREVGFVSNLYREDGHMVIQCNIRDITERKAMERALAAAAARNERIAETLQRSMLQTLPTGKFPGMCVETLYEAAMSEAAVGGDFFDVFALGGDKVALVVGDVSGKGLTAAGRTAEVKYALRAFLHTFPAPEIALAHLNDFIAETHRSDTDSAEMFIVLAQVVVDTGTGEAVFTAAGAEPTLILRADGSTEQIEITGLPLGTWPGAIYTAKTSPLAAGDTVLMSTDGITEARHGQSFLGVDGLATLAEKAGATVPLPELCQAIYAGACAFAQGRLRDDVCLLLARRQ